MEIPVFLITGFLESGKTSFIMETMKDPEFYNGEKTLVSPFYISIPTKYLYEFKPKSSTIPASFSFVPITHNLPVISGDDSLISNSPGTKSN